MIKNKARKVSLNILVKNELLRPFLKNKDFLHNCFKIVNQKWTRRIPKGIQNGWLKKSTLILIKMSRAIPYPLDILKSIRVDCRVLHRPKTHQLLHTRKECMLFEIDAYLPCAIIGNLPYCIYVCIFPKYFCGTYIRS